MQRTSGRMIGGLRLKVLEGKTYADPCEDPRPDLEEDSALWERLLRMAYPVDGSSVRGLFWNLHGCRCGGARLVSRDGKLRIDPGEWADEYPGIRQRYLEPFKLALIGFLKRMAEEDSDAAS